MRRRIHTLRHLENATMAELGLFLRGVAAVMSVMLILTVLQLSLRPKTAYELAWRIPAVLLYIANIVALQMQAFDPSIFLSHLLFLSLSLLCALNIANFVAAMLLRGPLWKVLYVVSALVQVSTIVVVNRMRTLLLARKDFEVHGTPPGVGIQIEEESKTPLY